jgi:hypothetical protein
MGNKKQVIGHRPGRSKAVGDGFGLRLTDNYKSEI